MGTGVKMCQSTTAQAFRSPGQSDVIVMAPSGIKRLKSLEKLRRDNGEVVAATVISGLRRMSMGGETMLRVVVDTFVTSTAQHLTIRGIKVSREEVNRTLFEVLLLDPSELES